MQLDTLALPNDLLWSDEFDWSPVESASEYAVTGALVVDVAERQAGRPITLEADDNRAWIRRDTLAALYAKAVTPGVQMTLTIGATSYTVVWRPGAEPITARPIFPVVPTNDLHYVVTLRFTEV